MLHSSKLSILWLLACTLLTTACKEKSAATDTAALRELSTVPENNTRNRSQDTLGFHLPNIPVLLTDPSQRMEYLAQHYWDCITSAPADTALLQHQEELEQAWANYCDLLHRLPTVKAQQAVKLLLPALETDDMKNYTYFKGLAEKYLDDPNSPLRNEEIYIAMLQAMTESSRLSHIDKIRPRERLKLALKNRVGNRAANFTYTLATGAQSNLYHLSADYTLVFFNNPGCEACAATIGILKSSPLIGRLLEEHRLIILAMYTDEEMEEWQRHLPDFPTEWINAYDKTQVIRTKQLYDLRAIPSLYLLNKNKEVLLKDASTEQVLRMLEEETIAF